MNAHAERFIRSIKSECLGRVIFVGQRSLDRAIKEVASQSEGSIEVKQRLDRILSYYHGRVA